MTKNNSRKHKKGGFLTYAIGLLVVVVFVCALGQGNIRKEVHGQEQMMPEGAALESVSESAVPEDADLMKLEAAENNDPVDDSYFDSSLLIGDSRAETLGLYSEESGWTAYTARNLDVETVQNSKFVPGDMGEMCTVPEMLSRKTYRSIYISFGIGELGWYKERFISAYRALLDRITLLEPSAKIYVMSILPVSAELSSKDAIINNPGIDNFNIGLKELCNAYDNVVYLDVAGYVAPQGVLPEDAGIDGIHFKKNFAQKIMRYIKSNI